MILSFSGKDLGEVKRAFPFAEAVKVYSHWRNMLCSMTTKLRAEEKQVSTGQRFFFLPKQNAEDCDIGFDDLFPVA